MPMPTDSAKSLRDPLIKYPNASNDFNFVYKTGDKGCLREDGSLILTGRIERDTLIKLRGIRIDLSGVANSILTAAKGTVTDAVIAIRDPLGALRSKLPLPRYMTPSLILPLDQLPTTTNGKVDRKAIAAMPLPKQAQDRKHQMRLNVSEGELRLIWKEVLEEPLDAAEIGPETNFFTVGRSSLLLLRLQHAVKEKMRVVIELGDLYQSSTLRNIGAAANLRRSQLVSEAIDLTRRRV